MLSEVKHRLKLGSRQGYGQGGHMVTYGMRHGMGLRELQQWTLLVCLPRVERPVLGLRIVDSLAFKPCTRPLGRVGDDLQFDKACAMLPLVFLCMQGCPTARNRTHYTATSAWFLYQCAGLTCPCRISRQVRRRAPAARHLCKGWRGHRQAAGRQLRDRRDGVRGGARAGPAARKAAGDCAVKQNEGAFIGLLRSGTTSVDEVRSRG